MGMDEFIKANQSAKQAQREANRMTESAKQAQRDTDRMTESARLIQKFSEQADIEIRTRVSREFLDQLQGWNGPLYVRLLPEVNGYREFEFVRSPRSPLGITDEARQRGEREASLDVVREITAQFLEKIQEGLRLLDLIPDGTVIKDEATGLHIIESVR